MRIVLVVVMAWPVGAVGLAVLIGRAVAKADEAAARLPRLGT